MAQSSEQVKPADDVDATPSARSDRFVLTMVIALSRLANAIPWPVLNLFTALAGLVVMLTPRRHVVLANVRHARSASPPPSLVAWLLGAQQITSHFRTVAGTLRASIVPPDASRMDVRGAENLVPILNQRGVVLVAPHAGPYTTLGIMGRQWLADQGFTGELVVVARMFKPLRSDVVMDWFVNCLARVKVTIIPVDEDPGKLASRLRKTLENKGIVVLLVDEPTPTPSRYIPFFDSTIRMPVGPARLARVTGAAIVPVMATYVRGQRQLIDISPAIEPASDPVVTLRQIARQLETLISRKLGQWSMLTPIWSDAGPETPAGYSVAELHLHTRGSDGLCDIEEWRTAARAARINVIAITDHDHIATARNYRPADDDDSGVIVIPGVELTARGRIVHLGVLFTDEVPERLPKPGAPLPDLVRWARSIPGSIVILVHPHPFLWQRQLRGLAELGLLPDAMETRFPLQLGRSKRLERAATAYGIAALGGSDAHLSPGQLGRHVTVFPGAGAEHLARAIRERTTRPQTFPPLVDVPFRVYPLQSLASWMLPFRGLPGVETARLRLMDRARAAALTATPRPAGIAAPIDERPAREAARGG